MLIFNTRAGWAVLVRFNFWGSWGKSVERHASSGSGELASLDMAGNEGLRLIPKITGMCGAGGRRLSVFC